MKAPLPTVKRGPLYMRILREYQQNGIEWISATDIALRFKLTPIQVRKDLALTGVAGTPKKGFKVEELLVALREFLGWNNTNEAFIVGAGSLGSALLGHKGFADHGLSIVAAFDTDPDIVGTVIHQTKVMDIKKLKNLVKRMDIKIGIITVPAVFAQATAELLVDAGVKGIWNFTSAKLKLPDDVIVHREDLSSGFAVLSAKISELENLKNHPENIRDEND